MTKSDEPGAVGFEAADHTVWSRAVEQLTGRPVEELGTVTDDGVAVPALGSDDAEVSTVKFGDGSGWTVAQRYVLTRAGALVARLAHDVKYGLQSAWVAMHPSTRALVGHAPGTGLIIDGVADIEALLTAGCALQWEAGAAGVGVAGLLASACQLRGMPLAELEGAVLCDPLGAAVEVGGLGVELERGLADVCAVTRWAAEHAPRLRTIAACGLPYHRGGATAVLELALVVATGIEYMRAAQQGGLAPDVAAPRMVLRFGIGSELLVELAKIRAARRLWSGVLAQFGVSSVAPQIHGCTSACNKTVYDPWTNLLRATVEGIAATVAAVDELAIQPLSEPIGIPDDDARRWALDIHHLLASEAHLAKSIDPAAGSGYVEHLTRELSRRAWELVREIELAGGMKEFHRGVALRVAEAAQKRMSRYCAGDEVLVGTSLFPSFDEPKVATCGGAEAVERTAPFGSLERFDRVADAVQRGTSRLCSWLAGGRIAHECDRVAEVRFAAGFERARERIERAISAGLERPVFVIVALDDAPKPVLAAAQKLGNAGGFAVRKTSEHQLEVPTGPRWVAIVVGLAEGLSPRVAPLATRLRNQGADFVAAMTDEPARIEQFAELGVDAWIDRCVDAFEFYEDVQRAIGVGDE